jgi:hypothetical protein
MILSVKKFNELQDEEYKDYCDKCKTNGVKPEPQSKYFPKIRGEYGFVYFNNFGEVYWKRNKKDFN